MSRQIKFRVWDTKLQKMINWNPFIRFDDSDYVVQQFTGLFDANGKEIYEGDIVEASHLVFDLRYKDNRRLENYSGLIRWHHSYWAIKDYKLSVMEDESLKVIGNIFQNQELLVN